MLYVHRPIKIVLGRGGLSVPVSVRTSVWSSTASITQTGKPGEVSWRFWCRAWRMLPITFDVFVFKDAIKYGISQAAKTSNFPYQGCFSKDSNIPTINNSALDYKYMCQIQNRVVEGAENERCQRFAALSSTRDGPFHLLLPPPCPPASSAPGEGLHGGLFEGSSGRRRLRSMRIRLDIGTYAPASWYETLMRRWRRKTSNVNTTTDMSMIYAVSYTHLTLPTKA